MLRIVRVAEGSAAGLFAGTSIVCIGNLISSSWLGICLTILFGLVMGFSINMLEGAVAGLISGAVACLFSDMVSQTVFGIACTILLTAVIGGIVGWETSRQGHLHRS